MPVVNMELTGFSFKRDHEDWIGPIEVSITNSNPCVVLTGINAGGKSLTLRALDKFTKLLADPCVSNKEEFEVLARAAGIDEISATYESEFHNDDWGIEDPLYHLEIIDSEKVLSAATTGQQYNKNIRGIFNPDGDDLYYKMGNSIETQFTKDGGFTRRYGVQFWAEFDLEGENSNPYETEEAVIDEQVFSKWEQVFEDSKKLAKDRMFSYGFDGFEEKILQRTGIKFESIGFSSHHFWEQGEGYIFVAKKAIMLQVDEAYQVSAETMEKLRPFNENANAKRKGKTWINKRLRTAFEKCRQEYDIDEKGKLKFGEFLYPKRKLHDNDFIHGMMHMGIYYDDWSSMDGLSIDDTWVSEPELPTVNMSFPPEQMKEEVPDFNKDIQGITERIGYHCPYLLRDYDPDLLFWIIASNFIDFPEDPSPTYYSSGQRRMISIIEAVMKSERGDVLLIDEPELSLHIDWQRRFIDQISIFGMKLVIATHSPDIIYNHTEKVVEVPPSKEV